MLKYFAQEGIVALRRGTITILDREKLRRLTGMASVEERTPRPQKISLHGDFPRRLIFMLWIFPKKKAQLPPPLSAQRGQQGIQHRPGLGPEILLPPLDRTEGSQ